MLTVNLQKGSTINSSSLQKNLLLLIVLIAGALFGAPLFQSDRAVAKESNLLNGLSPYRARVTSVKDGDTLTVSNESKNSQAIRVYSVDAPEWNESINLKQSFGKEARDLVRSIVQDTEVTIIPRERDFMGRLVAVVVCADGELLADKIVGHGAGWWSERYAPKNRSLPVLQEAARKKKLGIWADPKAVPPWEFRREFFKKNPDSGRRRGGR